MIMRKLKINKTRICMPFMMTILMVNQLWAQTNTTRKENKRQQLEAYKQQYIKEVLALSEKDAIAFFPVYKAYEEEKKAHRQKLNELKRGFMAKSDEQLAKDLDAIVALKGAELETEKKYLEKFKSVISVRQVAALYHAESQFKKKLLERYGNNN